MATRPPLRKAITGEPDCPGESIGLEQVDGHAPDQTEFEFRVRFELAPHVLDGANIGASTVRGQEEKEGRQVFFVQVGVAAGGDCLHGTAVLAFRANGSFAFCSALFSSG